MASFMCGWSRDYVRFCRNERNLPTFYTWLSSWLISLEVGNFGMSCSKFIRLILVQQPLEACLLSLLATDGLCFVLFVQLQLSVLLRRQPPYLLQLPRQQVTDRMVAVVVPPNTVTSVWAMNWKTRKQEVVRRWYPVLIAGAVVSRTFNDVVNWMSLQ